MLFLVADVRWCECRGLKDVSANVAEQLKAVLLQWRRTRQLPSPSAADVSSLFQLVDSILSSLQHPVLQLLC